MTAPHDPQQSLPFAQAEATAADRLHLLGLALLRVDADLHLAQFVRWLYNTADAGAVCRPLYKSYEELAAKPWGLCCSRSKAQATVAAALRAGFAQRSLEPVAPWRNGYTLDWEGVRRIVRAPLHRAIANRGVAPQQPPVAPQQPPVAPQQPPVAPQQFYKEYPSLYPSLNSGRPDARPEFWEGEDSKRGDAGADDAGLVARPVPPLLLRDIPELAAAVTRVVLPLPAGPLLAAVFEPLSEKLLEADEPVIRWHRAQLSAHRPAMGDTVAHLLLLLALRRQVAALPRSRARNPLGLWIARVRRQQWAEAARFVPAAAADLAAWEARFPELLSSATWPPPRAAPEAVGQPSLPVGL